MKTLDIIIKTFLIDEMGFNIVKFDKNAVDTYVSRVEDTFQYKHLSVEISEELQSIYLSKIFNVIYRIADEKIEKNEAKKIKHKIKCCFLIFKKNSASFEVNYALKTISSIIENLDLELKTDFSKYKTIFEFFSKTLVERSRFLDEFLDYFDSAGEVIEKTNEDENPDLTPRNNNLGYGA